MSKIYKICTKFTPYPAAFFNEEALRMNAVTWWKAPECNSVQTLTFRRRYLGVFTGIYLLAGDIALSEEL